MSGTYVPQLPAGPFLTAKGKCGPASTLQRTLGQLPGLVLSRRILFSEKQAQGGMFLEEGLQENLMALPLPTEPSRSDWLVSDTHSILGGAFTSLSKVNGVMGWG